MDVADQAQQVLVLVADNGFVSSLKKMADFSITAVEILSIGLLESLHEFGQRSGAGL
jgi:hypothetical protein